MARADFMETFVGQLPAPVDVLGPLATMRDLVTADIYASEPIEIVVQGGITYGGCPSDNHADVLVDGVVVACIAAQTFMDAPCPFAVTDHGTGCEFEPLWGASPLTETVPGCIAYKLQDLDGDGCGTERRIGGLYLPALLQHAATNWGWRSKKHPALAHLRAT
jgi:hypothetical protein